MSDAFDPYYKWLGIPPRDQPPNYYRLFGLQLYESDSDVISHAADRVMAHVRTYQTGQHSAHSQKLLNELAKARGCLEAADKRAKYDSELKAKLAQARAPAAPPQNQAATTSVPSGLANASHSAGPSMTTPARQPVAASPDSSLPQPSVAPGVAPRAKTSAPVVVSPSAAPKPSALTPPPKPGVKSHLTSVSAVIPLLLADWRKFLSLQPVLVLSAVGGSMLLFGMLLGVLAMSMAGPRRSSPGAVAAAPTENDGPINSPAAATAAKPLTAPEGVTADKLVVWNQWDGVRNRGATGCIVHLFLGDKEVWTSRERELGWDLSRDVSTTIDLPPQPFDRLRFEVTKWHDPGGGVAELQVFKDGVEISRGCPVRASSYRTYQNRAERAVNGSTGNTPSGHWLLPDNQPGWIDLDLSRAVGPKPGVKAERVVLWNSHNSHGNNAGAEKIDLLLLRNQKAVWSKREIEFPWSEGFDNSLSFDLPDLEFDAVRVEVTDPVEFSSLSEIEVFRDGENIALGCPTLCRASYQDGNRSSRVVDGIRNSNQPRTGFWLSDGRNPNWVQVDLSSTVAEDGMANRRIGEYYAFLKEDWRRGLPWLARSDDPQLRLAAEQSRQRNFTSSELVSLADIWWDLGEQAGGQAAYSMKLQAMRFYARASVNYGLDTSGRYRVQQRLHVELPNFREAGYLYFNDASAQSGIFRGRRCRDATIVARDQVYKYGFWAHPTTKGSSRLSFPLSEGYKTLTGSVGIHQDARGRTQTAVLFRIVGDGRVLWRSGPHSQDNVIQSFRVDISGVRQLELFVDCPGKDDYAQAVWLDPLLMR